MALQVRHDLVPHVTGVRSELLYPTSQLLSQTINVPVQPNKAIVGLNAFAHEAGIHQDGVIKHALTYEIMTPQSVGVPANRLVLGKHSGRHALQRRCEELGFHLDAGQLGELYRRFTELADRKKMILDEDLIRIVHHMEQSLPSVI